MHFDHYLVLVFIPGDKRPSLFTLLFFSFNLHFEYAYLGPRASSERLVSFKPTDPFGFTFKKQTANLIATAHY